jgi:hypothetical protein
MSADLQILSGAMERLQNNPPDSLPIAWPGIDFNPPTGQSALWLEPSLFPADNDNIAWQGNAKVRFSGFFQVLVGYRNSPDGIKPAYEVAEQIVTLYAKGTALGPVAVSRRPSIGPPVADEGRNYLPVTIPYLGIA